MNLEVVKLAIGLVNPTNGMVHLIEKQPMPVLADRILWVKPPGMVVRDGVSTIFWCQPCRNFCDTLEAFSVYNSLLVDRYQSTGIYDKIDTECYDFQIDKDTKVRAARIIRLENAPAISRDELDLRLSILATALDSLVAEGIKKKAPIIKPPAPAVRGLFD